MATKTKPGAFDCYSKAEPDEPVFTLLARDPSAPLTDHHKNIARSAQATYETAFFNLLSALHERYDSDAVVLAGGCALTR